MARPARMRWPLASLAAAMMLALASPVRAADLLEVWQAARQHDPAQRALKAARDAGQARRAQGQALWRPTVGLSASAGLGQARSVMEGADFSAPDFGSQSGAAFSTQTDAGLASALQLGAKWPLYSPQRQAQSRQLELAADAARLQAQLADQGWTLGLVQRYFTAVLAERQLAVLRQQLQAAERLSREAQDRFELGDRPVTDTHEARARALALQAQVLQAEHALALARDHLVDLSALPAARLQSLATPAAPERMASPAPLAQWQAQAGQRHLRLALQQLQTEMAAEEVRSQRAGADTSVDLVAQAGSERLSGQGSQASTRQHRALLGVTVALPLSTGGWRSAKLEEALRLQDQASAELERLRQDVQRDTRAIWLGVQAAQARVTALTQGLQASQARLQATELGQQVGDRTTLELLQAQTDAAAAELALLQARIDLLQARVQLAAQAGQLDEAALREVNAALAAP